MEKYFALIKNNLVDKVVVADDAFLKHIAGQYDVIIDVTNLDRPSAGDSYYPDTKEFVSNTETLHELPVDLNQAHLQNGTENEFPPFRISRYDVSYTKGVIMIGCKRYSAPGFMDALHKMLIEGKQTVSIFSGTSHGKFEITRDDMQTLYDNLSRIKF